MNNHIDAATLTTFEVHPEGTHVRINVQDHEGLPGALVLPATCANQLMMIMPAMVERALRNSHKNEALRLAHPLDGIYIETGELNSDGIQQFVLTLDTGKGFHVSFAVSEEILRNLARTIFGDMGIYGRSAEHATSH